MANRCAHHPLESAVTTCSSCRRGLCLACWRSNVEKQPWCELCVYQLTRSGSRSALAVVFFLFGVAAGAWLLRHDFQRIERPSGFFWLLYALCVCLISAYLATRDPPHQLTIERRAEADTPTVPSGARVGHPYGAALLRASRLVASPLSGLWTSVLLIGCMGTAALAVPWLLRLPRWIEAEAVIAIWWSLWCIILTLLLYRGWRLSDDHVLAKPRMPWGSSKPAREPSLPGEVANDGLGCLEVLDLELLVLALTLMVIFGAAWLVVELALPGLFFCAYLLVRSSLARVANDEHACEGQLGRALRWGALWSSVVALPLAACVLLAHQMWRQPAELQQPRAPVAPAQSTSRPTAP
jgi:hypothetical protein